MDIITPIQGELLRAAASMLAKKEFNHLLYIGDLPLPEELVKAKSSARKKLVQAVTSDSQRQLVQAMGIEALSLPTYDIARRERFKMALVGGIAKGLFQEGEVVLGIVGRSPTSYPDTMMVVTIGRSEGDGVTTGFGVIGSDRIPSAIMESVIELAVEIGRDGWEGRPLGTLLVVGDSATVLEKSHQLTLNPFQGYSEAEKNILNPKVRDSIRNFAVLDGAFVIREDGVVLAAGRYLKFDYKDQFDVPLGHGARHVAAAGISQDTAAIAIVVSETSGTLRVYQSGTCVLEINPEQRSRRSGSLEHLVAYTGDEDELLVTEGHFPAAKESEGDGDESGKVEAPVVRDTKEHKVVSNREVRRDSTKESKDAKESKSKGETKEGKRSKST